MKKAILLFPFILLALSLFGQKQKTYKNKKQVPKKHSTIATKKDTIATKEIEYQLPYEPVVGTPPVEAPPRASEDKVFTRVEDMPEFPGGQRALMRYLQTNLVYPADAIEEGIEGKVVVEFTVCEDGKLCDEKILRSVGGGCDQEALRVVKKMPAWKPGMNDGKPVKTRYMLPISYKLQDPEPATPIEIKN